jgi:hypothetical protein
VIAPHRMDRLARCLTHIAAIRDSGARDSLRRSGPHPACPVSVTRGRAIDFAAAPGAPPPE